MTVATEQENPRARIVARLDEIVRLLRAMRDSGAELPKDVVVEMLLTVGECLAELTGETMRQGDAIQELRHIAQHGVIVDAPCDVTDCEYRARPRRLDA